MDIKNTNIKERILQLANYKGVSYQKFFEELELNYSNFKGKQKLSGINSNSIERIISKYPELNLRWLITNEGEMVVSSEKEENTQKLDTMKKEMKNYKQMYYEQLDKNMLLHEKLLACMEGDAFSKDVG
ncbi:hypothetical protein [Tenacibaculum finnmarkense]|uniref:hypothetical protein n=1 Tax=Tenacibaculum finnmarkense TaxID=2781243 RepID=UPI001EFB5D51|nr:hypothetical protein [Tenacibaculum finnmarkense]MCG8734616.1 hypothetical protein [Tenacibaculum finnmarkense]